MCTARIVRLQIKVVIRGSLMSDAEFREGGVVSVYSKRNSHMGHWLPSTVIRSYGYYEESPSVAGIAPRPTRASGTRPMIIL